MTLSDLETALKALEASLSRLETTLTILSVALLVSTGVVVIGLFIEYRPDFKEFIWGRPRDRRGSWPVVIGGIMVILGVSGELVCSFWALKVESKIRTTNSKIEDVLRSEISLVGTSAVGAVKAANAANTVSQEASAIAGTAKATAAGAKSLAQGARQEADSASRELGTLRTDTQNLESEAKKTEADLMNVAVCTAPRVLDSWFVGKTSYVDPLRPMAGQVVFIEVMPDAESRRAAKSLANALAAAKWDIQSIKQVGELDELKDGVSVEPSDSAFDPQGWGAWLHAGNVSDALVDFLHSHNWQAKRDWWLDSKGMTEHDPKIAPFGSIRIQVGLYPATEYLSPPADKQLVATLEERKREADALEAKDWESRVAGLLPAEREVMERRRKEWEADTQKVSNRYTMTGPCQDLFSKYF